MGFHQFAADPLCDRGRYRVPGSKTLRSAVVIQSDGKPCALRHSFPLNHLIPSIRLSDEKLTANADFGSCFAGLNSMPRECIRLACETLRCNRCRYWLHWRGISQEFDGGCGSKTSDQEDAAAHRGSSETLSVQHPPASHIPALSKPLNDGGKVPPICVVKHSRDVLSDHPFGPKIADDAKRFKEKPGRFTVEALLPSSPGVSGIGEVCAGPAERDAIHRLKVFRAHRTDVRVACGIGKSVTKHSPVDGVDLDLPHRFPPRPFKAKVESADAGKQASECRSFSMIFLRAFRAFRGSSHASAPLPSSPLKVFSHSSPAACTARENVSSVGSSVRSCGSVTLLRSQKRTFCGPCSPFFRP